MKRLIYTLALMASCGVVSIVLYSCAEEYLERPPIGQISGITLDNKAGVNGILIGAYSLLDGSGVNGVSSWNTSPWNAWLGSVGADDAHKGGGFGSQNERAEVENYTYTSVNPIFNDQWMLDYAGIQRANEALRALDNLPAGELTEEEALQIRAEARFLRGVYHFQAAKTWRNIPYVDETITFNAGNYKVSNAEPAWPKIEEDFMFAIENLTPTKAQIGRAHSWAAKAFLAKTYMFQGKFTEAKPLLDDIITNGVTAGGAKFQLEPQYSQLFRPSYENGTETVFAVQMSVNDGGQGRNGNEGESFNYPPWIMGGWGNQPSFNLVNAFKTENGLPMIYTFNDEDVKSDMGIDVTEPFTPYEGPLDPRLDWTVSRRHIPFHDWGTQEIAWDVAGPYRQKKTVHWKQDEGGVGSEVIDGWQQASGINFDMIRFADVLLWAAEVEVEIGSLQQAEDYVNMVRNRAANPEGFLKEYIDNEDPSQGFSETPAANYIIAPYNGEFVAQGQDFAREAVRFERRLEFGMEGHRFFDLQRYDLTAKGYMANVLNTYMKSEVATFEELIPGQTYPILKGYSFQQGVDEIYAIPQVQIDQSKDGDAFTLKQNPGH